MSKTDYEIKYEKIKDPYGYKKREQLELELLDSKNYLLYEDELEQCDKFYNSVFLENNGTIDIKYVSDTIYLKFFNPSIMNGYICLLKSIIKYNKYWGKEIPLLGEGIQKYFSNINKLSTGGQGSVFSVKLTSSINNLLLIKVANIKQYELLHEFLIGNTLNKLRSLVPNFIYVYGMFRCDQFQFNESVDVNYAPKFCLTKSFEKDKEYTYYMLSEYIQGKTLRECLINMYELFRGNLEIAYEGLLSWIVQTFKALDVAHTYYKYTHYDLHCDNVIIRTLTDTTEHMYVYYPPNVFGVYAVIKTYIGIPTIIDFGNSTLVDESGILQDSKLQNSKSEDDESEDTYIQFLKMMGIKSGNRIGHDIYKLTGHIGFYLYYKWLLTPRENSPTQRDFYKKLFIIYNKNVLEPIRAELTTKIAKSYIHPEKEYLDQGKKTQFSLPVSDEFGNNVNINKLIKSIVKTSNIIIPLDNLKSSEHIRIINIPDDSITFEDFINNSVKKLDTKI